MSRLIAEDDYYMGIALLSCSRTIHGKSILFVDDFENYHVCTGEHENSLDPEYFMASTHGLPKCKSIFLTYTPNSNSIKMLANTDVKKIIFFQTENIEEDTISLCSNINIDICKYKGNIHWMRDYIFFMRSKDIL